MIDVGTGSGQRVYTQKWQVLTPERRTRGFKASDARDNTCPFRVFSLFLMSWASSKLITNECGLSIRARSSVAVGGAESFSEVMAEEVKSMNEYPDGLPDILWAVERWENEGGRFDLTNFTPDRGAGNNALAARAPASRRRATKDDLRIEVK